MLGGCLKLPGRDARAHATRAVLTLQAVAPSLRTSSCPLRWYLGAGGHKALGNTDCCPSKQGGARFQLHSDPQSRLGMNGYFHIPAPEVVRLHHIVEGSPLIAHFLFRMNFAKSRFDALAHRLRTTDGPEVHKKQARLLTEHVAMESRHQNIASLQLG